MLGYPSQSDGVLWYQEAVSFDVVHHRLEGGALLVVLYWVFAIFAGVAACPYVQQYMDILLLFL